LKNKYCVQRVRREIKKWAAINVQQCKDHGDYIAEKIRGASIFLSLHLWLGSIHGGVAISHRSGIDNAASRC
jgi:hypothetical protein